jgi:eukaryotic-like serine/threonine-protein kinase
MNDPRVNDPALDARAKPIVGELLDSTADDRARRLDELVAADAPLAARVRRLLDAALREDDFLREPTMLGPPGIDSAASNEERPGMQIGPYKLLEHIGEGGFGSVFMAEQATPVRRRVAIKVLKPGMDSRAVVARFEQERQALALMDHPSIAKVLDAGVAPSGRPFFAMELVKGDPITVYCDRARNTVRERLELFAQVCRAVQHAHTKGIIHRDLKPSNVLVALQDGKPIPKIIDFGIAKAIFAPLTERTLVTEFHQLVGTPEYMSPEQAAGSLDIDTRSDVYALGVLLYELLAGTTPIEARELRSAAFDEMRRLIREVESPAPSTRVATLANLAQAAANRRTEPGRLSTILRGELDWIAMRALEKERSRRYTSPGDLADDVERHLSGEAVRAAPPTRTYRLRTFVRRNRAGVVTAGAVFAALALGLALAAWQARSAALERDIAVAAEAKARAAEAAAIEARTAAERSKDIAERVTEFFNYDLLDLAPRREGEPDVTVRQLLDAVPEKIDKYFSKDPAVEAAVRQRVGQLYFSLGETTKARAFLEASLPLYEKSIGPDERETLSAVQRLSTLELQLGNYARAAELFDRAYQSRLRTLGPDNNFTVHSLSSRGDARVRAGDATAGLADIDKAESEAARLNLSLNQRLIIARTRYNALVHLTRWADAEALCRAALGQIATAGESSATAEPSFRGYLGTALNGQSRFAEAIEQFDLALASPGQRRPTTHPTVVGIRVDRAQALAALDRVPEAIAELVACHDATVAASGATSAYARSIARTLADLHERAGRADEAERWRGLDEHAPNTPSR